MTNTQYTGMHLLFGLPVLSPEVMVVYGTNQIRRFPSRPVPASGIIKPADICRLSSCLPLCLIQGPFLSHLLPGPVQYNLMIIYRALLSPGAARTLEVQAEISSLSQETPSSQLTPIYPSTCTSHHSKDPRGS